MRPVRDVLACVMVSVLHTHVDHAAHDDLMDLGQVCAGGAAARGPRRGISGGSGAAYTGRPGLCPWSASFTRMWTMQRTMI